MCTTAMTNGREGTPTKGKNRTPRVRRYFGWRWHGKGNGEVATAATFVVREASSDSSYGEAMSLEGNGGEHQDGDGTRNTEITLGRLENDRKKEERRRDAMAAKKPKERWVSEEEGSEHVVMRSGRQVNSPVKRSMTMSGGRFG